MPVEPTSRRATGRGPQPVQAGAPSPAPGTSGTNTSRPRQRPGSSKISVSIRSVGAPRPPQREQGGERGERVLHGQHGNRGQHGLADRVGHRGRDVGDHDVADLAKRRGGLLVVVGRLRTHELGDQGLARRRREQPGDHTREPALDLEEHAGKAVPLRVRGQPDEGCVGRLRAQQPHRGHAHAKAPADQLGECRRRVPGADVRELAQPVELVGAERELTHASWFTSSTKTGRPSPSTVHPARVRAHRSRGGTGLT